MPTSRLERAMRTSQEAAQEQLRAEPQHRRILAYGDSLTAGYVPCEECCVKERDGCKDCQRKPWADALRRSLNIDVDHWGCEGWTTAMHVSEMDQDGLRRCGLRSLLAKAQGEGRPYSAVFIMSGANDLADGASAAAIVENLAVLHRAARAFGARTVALSIPESRGWAEEAGLGERGRKANTELGQLPWCDGDNRGESLFVDAPLRHPDEPGLYTSDGLHLTAEGYAAFGTRLATNELLTRFIQVV